MELKDFQAQLFERGRALGFTDMEVYYQADKNTSVRVFKGEIDAYSLAEKAGLSFRGQIGGRMGYSYTENLEESSLDFLLREAQENAEVLEGEREEKLFGGSESYPQFDEYSAALADTPSTRLIEAAKEMERIALGVDPRIDLVNFCIMSAMENELSIFNTKGLNCSMKSSLVYGYVSAVGKSGEDVTTGSENAYVLDDFEKLDIRAIAERAAKEAISKLGAQSIESDNYPVILRNDVAASLLSAFASIFSGEKAERALTKLQGRIGEQVAGGNITIIDDPLRAGAPGSVPFDSEGMATSRHEVIKDGQLVTFLHNRKTAKKAGVVSTGNAVKGSYKSPVSVAPNNLYVVPGDSSLDELIAGTERGLLLVELQGLHAGTNAVSGDFSLAAIGHLIEDGKIVRPVNQITVSGNYFDVLNSVEALGNDLRFNTPARGACGSPSLKVKSLTISGK